MVVPIFYYPTNDISYNAKLALLLLLSSSFVDKKTLTLLFTHTNWQLPFKFGCHRRTTSSSDNFQGSKLTFSGTSLAD